MSRPSSLEKRLISQIANLEFRISRLQEELAVARKNHESYLANTSAAEAVRGAQAGMFMASKTFEMD